MNTNHILLAKRSAKFCVVLAVAALYAGCGRGESLTNDLKPHRCAVPEGTNDGWETASPGEVGLDTNLVAELSGRINDHDYTNIHSVLLVKNGKLVVEKYCPGRNSEGRYQAFTRDTLHEMHSATKSVNSILVGIAIDQHLIRGVDEKISNFFPEYSDIFTNREKDAIRLKDLLSMTAGLSWDEATYPYTDPRNDAAVLAGRADFSDMFWKNQWRRRLARNSAIIAAFLSCWVRSFTKHLD
jgi:CubicO group peptidase (beta-lactamase class C family)